MVLFVAGSNLVLLSILIEHLSKMFKLGVSPAGLQVSPSLLSSTSNKQKSTDSSMIITGAGGFLYCDYTL